MARTRTTPLIPNNLRTPTAAAKRRGPGRPSKTEAAKREQQRLLYERFLQETRRQNQSRWQLQHQSQRCMQSIRRAVNTNKDDDDDVSDVTSSTYDSSKEAHTAHTRQVQRDTAMRNTELSGDEDELTADDSISSLDEEATANSSHASDKEVSNASENERDEKQWKRATGDACKFGESSQRVMDNNDDEERVEIQQDLLLHRFGSPKYYEEVFLNLIHSDPREVYETLEATKGNNSDSRYEEARQEFLKIYGKHKGTWHATSSNTDRLVDATKLHVTPGQEEYLGFLRIQPNGYRGERIVSAYMEIRLHLLMGKVLLTYKKRQRTMTRGSYVHIVPNTTFNIKCISHDQAALFVIKILIDKERQLREMQHSSSK